ncbi:hypothetical protein M752DRAFT_290039 [Aspergillus phoenicis ATCC 13157]|uniref:C6 finger domain protein n=1 Tax=Aspergillus phoenicis ATCC 13157 TaxID=1353007 RepID=A0A370PWG3_ASPPH|nr:hypothetical protein M752DRAFT_290039 [Aspergillus phoenicis ATCC 13157]
MDDPPKTSTVNSLTGTAGTQPSCSVDELFDFASFTWSPDAGAGWQLNHANMNSELPLTLGQAQVRSSDDVLNALAIDEPVSPTGSPPCHEEGLLAWTASPDNERLMTFFSQSGNPPLLAEVETKKTWVSMRRLVIGMARESKMVQSAVLAFSCILFNRQEGLQADARHYYMSAEAEVLAFDKSSTYSHDGRREHLLVSLFFLTYVDVLQSRLEAAYSHLNCAYSAFQLSCKDRLTFSEKQLFLWFRILDGRCVSSGGDGLFLSHDHDLLTMESSPASFTETEYDQAAEDETEGLLFQILCQSGIIFYQKVLGLMSRVAKIDPWHRSRGTVEDETEVMEVAKQITQDLLALYDSRPPLMDHAVEGRLTDQHLSPNLAFTLTRSFRTYLANYYATKIHLHRVAYKTLPLTKDALEALEWIRMLLHQLIDALRPDDVLPINMMWPLLMLGAEVPDPEEKRWTRNQILQTEKVASNARITAQVLEVVQSRQDSTGTRMDIREAMYEVFNATFPII